MANKKGINFFFGIFAIIIGAALYKQFDFETYHFKKPALAAVYLVTFVVCVGLIIKDYRKKAEK